MAFTFGPYRSADHDAGRAAPGAKALMRYCVERWDFASDWGVYVPRSVAGSTTLSHHAEGRALDIGIPTRSPTMADAAKGMQIVDALGTQGRQLGIDQLIYNRTIWSGRKPDGREYTGRHPHYDHIHVGLTREAGADLSLEAVVSLLGGDQTTTDVPTLERPTHRVDAVGLRLRAEPSERSAIVGEFENGAAVERLDEPAHATATFRWVKVRTVVGGRLREGWVADEFLLEG